MYACTRTVPYTPLEGVYGTYGKENSMGRPRMLEFLDYSEYLHTDAWHAVRMDAIARAGGKCEWCGGPGPFEIHHLDYSHLGEPEELDDVRCLCVPCHRSAHDPARGETRRIGELLPGALARIPREGPAKGEAG